MNIWGQIGIGLIILILIGIVLYFLLLAGKPKKEKVTTDPPKDDAKKKDGDKKEKWFIRKHPWWSIIIIVSLAWLALTNFAFTKAVFFGFFERPYRGFMEANGHIFPSDVGTPRSPQGKNLGGSIYWDEDAVVTVREGETVEEVDENGICFAGIFPPNSCIAVTYCAYTELKDWSASLIDFTALKTFLSRTILEKRGTTGKGKPVAIVSMPELVAEGRYYEENMCNETKIIREGYIQIGGNGPKTVQVEHKSTRMIQFEVEVGLREVSFSIPAGNRKQFWITPVQHKAYQASLDGEPVPAEGLIREHLAIVASVNGKRQVLKKASLFPAEAGDTDVTLVLNSAVENIEGEVVPAKVIVGIYL